MDVDLKALREVAEQGKVIPPSMVLTLLDRLEAAEKALDAILSWNVGNSRGLPQYQRELLDAWWQLADPPKVYEEKP